MTNEPKTYEFIREIFNNCSGNQMRDVSITEVETDDVEAWLTAYLSGVQHGANTAWTHSAPEDGVIVFEVVIDGLRERFTFTEV